ncbi:hypothetical protein NSS79_22040 [Paenibacillus sp. FSL L8-0436]|uniref:hypothetical protein n=1 Tax=Paenibacillus sp. FSL L8-0436 TaxID=2954686 RepID=UPI0031587DA2
MKYEWKKQDKALYLPAVEPAILTVPAFPYFMLQGEGNPNSEAFADAVGVLYSPGLRGKDAAQKRSST